MGEEHIKKEIEKVTDFFKSKYKATKIILFGSRAKNTHLKRSDIDILVVSPKFQKNYVKRLIKIYQELPSEEDFEIIALTPKEFKKRSKQFTIVKEAVQTGKVLYSS